MLDMLCYRFICGLYFGCACCRVHSHSLKKKKNENQRSRILNQNNLDRFVWHIVQARKLMRTFGRGVRVLLPNKMSSVTLLATEFA